MFPSRIARPDELVELGILPAVERAERVRALFRSGVLVPAAGGDGDGDGSSTAGSGDGSGDSAAAGSSDGSGDSAAAAGDSGDGSGDGGTTGDEPPEGWKPPTHAEWKAQQDAIAAANAERRKAERAAQSKETAGKKEAGKFEELYNDAEAKVGKITAAVSSTFVKSEVTAIAARLGFRNPGHAASLISTDGIEADVDLEGDTPKIEVSQATKAMIERRLTELAGTADGRYLVDEGKARQLQDAGGSASGGTAGGPGGGDMNTAIRRAAGRA